MPSLSLVKANVYDAFTAFAVKLLRAAEPSNEVLTQRVCRRLNLSMISYSNGVSVISVPRSAHKRN